jgi:NAD-dependent SIR2 family protein deacetylase
MKCERCGKEARTQTVQTGQGTQKTQLCADCVKIVVRPGKVFQVKK